jgi:RHS repeat-associated protein
VWGALLAILVLAGVVPAVSRSPAARTGRKQTRRFGRVLAVVVSIAAVFLVGAVSASADSWSVEAGTHYLKGGEGKVIASWSAREWQLWRKELESVGECMGVAEGCAAKLIAGKTPVENDPRLTALGVEAVTARGATGELQNGMDLLGEYSGTLPNDLGRDAIDLAELGPGYNAVVELGNGLDQKLTFPPGWSLLGSKELGEMSEDSETLIERRKGSAYSVEICEPPESEKCTHTEHPLPSGYYISYPSAGQETFGVVKTELHCKNAYTLEDCETLEEKYQGGYIPPGFSVVTHGVEAESSYYPIGKVLEKVELLWLYKPLSVCGEVPSGYPGEVGAEGTPSAVVCPPFDTPHPHEMTPEAEEHNIERGLPARPTDPGGVTLPTSAPSLLTEPALKEVTENAATRERIEEMLSGEKPAAEKELEEQELEGLGLGNAGEQERGSCHEGKSVNCATGDETQTQTDLSVDGRGPALQLALTYNSQLARKQTSAGPFGFGWTGSYSAHLELKNEGQQATVYQDNGSTVNFTRSGETWSAPPLLVQATLATAGGGYVYTLPNQTALHFNSSGQLTSEVDRNGNALTMTRGGEGRLESVADAAGRKITLKYDSEGQVESASDPMGHTVKYSYEGGNLTTVTLPGETSPSWQYKYDSSHELTSETDGRGNSTTREYSTAGQVVSETDPLHNTRKWAYAPTFTGTETTITEPNGSTTEEQFNEYGSPTSVTRAAGTSLAATTSDIYNGADELLSSTNPDGHTTEYSYNTTGDRTSEKNPDGDETQWEYDSTHDVIGITLPMGEKTTIKRNSHGAAEVIERPAPGSTTQKTSYKYDSTGDVESLTNPLEHTWKYEYDAYGDRKSETDPEGNKRTWEYNEDSQETATVSPRGNVTGGKPTEFTTKTERDAQGRVLKITDPLGHTTKYTYDADGDRETITDANSHKTTYSYNEDDAPIKVKEANGDVSEVEYDSEGAVIAQTDGNKHTTKYARNALEQTTEVSDPLGHKTLKEYDPAGNLIKLIDPAKRTTTYTYDPASRLTGVSYSDGKTPAVKYEYNKDGDRTTMTDGTGTSIYGYDQLDRMTESENGHKAVIKYEYDLANDQTKITYPNGKAATRAFDKDDRLEKVTDWSSNVTKFSYNQDSQLAATGFPTATKDEDTYAYNDADQMTEIKMKKSTETLASLVYTRDNDGQVKKTTAKSLPGTEAIENTYDEDNRLTKAGSTEYKYDAANNPTTTGSNTNTFNETDELTKGTSASYSYDELGERTKTTPTSGPATSYGYDQAGNLITVERPKEGTTPKIEDSYAYNGEGLRATETISGTTSNLTWQTASVELPLILANETDSFIYGPGSMPIEQIASGGTVTYLHHDQQGSTRLLTGSTGTVTGKCSYGAYGAPTCEGTTATPLGYDAQYTSTDTGLIYMRARTYDPATAQFLSVDPAVEATRAPYNYAEDNPINQSDPTGLGEWEPWTESFWTEGNVISNSPLNPIPYYEKEIESYESGCGYFASVSHGLEGAVAGAALFAGGEGEDEAAVGADEGVAGVIRGYTKHGLEQAIERDAGRGVSPSAILEAVRSPLSEAVQDDGATKYVGQNAVVVVSSDGNVITTYARNAAGVRDTP